MSQSELKVENIPFECVDLYQPEIGEIVKVLQDKLKSHFKDVTVEVTECPDLTKPPYHLVCKGLGGSPTIIEIGGAPYLLPRVMKEKLYDLKDVAKIVDVKPSYMLGAGAGPWPYLGRNAEMIINLEIENNNVNNKTRIAKVDTKTGGCEVEILPDTECRNALLSNIYCSQGREGEVLKIVCKERIGKDNFITAIRTILAEHFEDKLIGLGGVFLVKEGKVLQHVMPDFSKDEIHTETQLNNWLKFYEMSAPLVAVGTLVTADKGLDLRLQHFHSFSLHNEGGHYHYDTTPDTVEYIAYFGLGEKLYRLDRPAITHQFGRD
ncbi:UNVERIFIED_CONTAM: hypothetical protein PYX00_005514 [Menopon gallinae]|uniref:DUF1907 domain-containing protein n=1 Tax=Menopon gallinae TaxID=328185 RepID=A0AAW2HRQ4_9NEOP